MTADEMRKAVIEAYKTILGRNNYSQSLRDYCFKKHSNGKYYSDCSSSVTYSYKQAGYGFGIMNTVGLYNSTKLKDVPVIIKNGIIQNPEVLRVGDMLLFAGTDSSRKSAGYVGHVEMVYSISSTKVTICGHGSGTPRTTEMNAYCKKRYSSKTSTALGHKGLIRVRRYILDEQITPEKEEPKGDMDMKIKVTGSTVNLRVGPGTNYAAIDIAKKGDTFETVEIDPKWIPVNVNGELRWISKTYTEEIK